MSENVFFYVQLYSSALAVFFWIDTLFECLLFFVAMVWLVICCFQELTLDMVCFYCFEAFM